MPRWTIWPDQQVTRRKYHHCVVDPEGNDRYRSRLLVECIEFLEAEGVDTFDLRWSDPRDRHLACVVNRKAEEVTWQK